MFDLTAMGFLVGQGCGRWGNFFNQEAFGCNTTLPWGMYSEGTRSYLMGSTVTVQNGVTIDPNLPVHPTFLYESIWCLVGFILLFRYIKSGNSTATSPCGTSSGTAQAASGSKRCAPTA